MWRWVALIAGVVGLVGVSLWALLVWTLRSKYQPLLTAVRRLNRAFWNRRAMKTAGQPGAYASVIQHAGRHTGTPYQTPVGVVDTDDGFLIALPYGTSPDWLKNVLTTGSAVIVSEGHTFHVENPELISGAQCVEHFSRKEQQVHRLYGVDQFLILRRATVDHG